MARGPSQWQLLGLKPDRGVIAAMIALAVVWIAFAVGGAVVQAFYVEHLMLTPRLGLGREPWQLLSSGFVHVRGADLVWTAVGLIFFGNPIEQQLGERAFWRVFIGGAIASAVAAAVVGRFVLPDQPIPVTMGSTTALLMAFGAAWRSQPVMAYGVAQMRASALAWVFLGITVLMVLLAGMPWRATLVELGAVAGAAAAGWVLASRGGVGGLRGSLDKMRMWRLKRRYRVLSGGRSAHDDKRYLN